MFVPFLTSALLALVIGLHLVVAWILVRKYLRTRDGGYIWLGFAVVIWPYFSVLLHLGERALTNRALTSQAAASFPFSLVQRGQMTMGDLSMLLSSSEQLIGPCLLLLAVLSLGKSRSGVEPKTST
jgi:hypothetical protein